MTAGKKNRSSSHTISGLFAFVLFALFIVLMMLMVLITAQGYRKTVDRSEETARIRTALGYIEGKIQQGAGDESYSLFTVDGNDALMLSQKDEDDDLINTAIYIYRGKLMEQFYFPDEMDFEAEHGQLIVPMEHLSLKLEHDNLIRICVTDIDGREQSLRVGMDATGEALQ